LERTGQLSPEALIGLDTIVPINQQKLHRRAAFNFELMSAELDHKLFGAGRETGGATAIFEVSALGDDPEAMLRMKTI